MIAVKEHSPELVDEIHKELTSRGWKRKRAGDLPLWGKERVLLITKKNVWESSPGWAEATAGADLTRVSAGGEHSANFKNMSRHTGL